MDEVEFLGDAFGSTKPGRIAIMDSGKLIYLGSLQQLRSAHGEGLVIKQLSVSEGEVMASVVGNICFSHPWKQQIST